MDLYIGSWILPLNKVPGEIKWMDPQVSPEEIMSWAAKVGNLSLRVVPQQQCNGHCPCDCPARQLKQQLRSALVAAQWRGDTALTLPLLWRRSTVSPVFFGLYPRSSLHFLALSPPPPPPPPAAPSLISHLASVDVKQYGPGPAEQNSGAV